MSKKITVILVISMALVAILLNVYAMGRDGFDADKITICIWAFNTIIWCSLAYRLS